MLKTFFIQGKTGIKKKSFKALKKTGEMLMFDITLTKINKIYYSPIGGNDRALVLFVMVLRGKYEGTADQPVQMHQLSTNSRKNISVFFSVSGLTWILPQ